MRTQAIVARVRLLAALGVLLVTALAPLDATACLRITKVDLNAREVTVTNIGTEATAGNHWLYAHRRDTVFDGALLPGESTVVSVAILPWNSSSASVHATPLFGMPATLLDFVQWGSSRPDREAIALLKRVWDEGTYVEVPLSRTLEWRGQTCYDTGAEYWAGAVPTQPSAWGAVKALFEGR